MTSKGNRLFGLLATVLVASAIWPVAAMAALSYPVESVSFQGTTGYIAGGGTTSGFISATSDGGVAWRSTIAEGRFMYAVSVSTDSAAAMAVGDFDGARATANSGTTWTAEEPLLSRVGTNLRGVAYMSGNRRVVVGGIQSPMKYAVIASSVSGGSWSTHFQGPVYLPPDEDTDPTPTDAIMSAVDAAPGGNVAWAVGTNRSLNPQSTTGEAMIYKTTNGSDWATQTASGSYNITGVTAVDESTVFVGSSNNRVLRTTNGGSTWTPLTPTSSVTINAIDAVDADTVVIVGDAGKVAVTTNASAATPTWTLKPAGTTNALLGVKMLDATHWVVVGDKETILRTSDGGATWAGSTAAAAPTVAITSPAAGSLLSGTSIVASGTATDGSGVGVAKVQVRLQRADGQYWSGSAWTASETWLQATPEDNDAGLVKWEAAVLPDTSTAGSGATLSARAIDGFGLVGPVVSIASNAPTAITPRATSVVAGYNSYVSIGGALASGGNGVSGKSVRLLSAAGSVLAATTTGADGAFSFSVKPALRTTYRFSFVGDGSYIASNAQVTVAPKAYVGKPSTPSSVKRNRYFKAYADLKPRHTAGSKAMTFTFERYQRKSSGGYGWVRLKTASAKAANRYSYSRCTVRVKLAKGSWRVSATHSDAGHATTTSSWRSFRVK